MTHIHSPHRLRANAPTLAFAVLGLAFAGAAASGNFTLLSGTADGGGQYSQGARFAVEGTIGQPDTARLNSNRFTIEGGFWPTTRVTSDTIFANNFED
jgi:hypothetical protein